MKNQSRAHRAVRLAVAIVMVTFAGSAVRAAQLVTFTRGQSIVVQSVEMRGAWYYFTLEGGGQVGVPVNQVAKVEDYEAPPPPASPAPGAPVAAAAAVAPAPQGVSRPLAATSPAPSSTPGQQADPTAQPPAPSQPNVAAQGNDDWRYKVRMSGGPHQFTPNPHGGPGARGVMPGGTRLPAGAQRPGGLPIPLPLQQQKQNPTN